jgi:hypothetical protein
MLLVLSSRKHFIEILDPNVVGFSDPKKINPFNSIPIANRENVRVELIAHGRKFG